MEITRHPSCFCPDWQRLICVGFDLPFCFAKLINWNSHNLVPFRMHLHWSLMDLSFTGTLNFFKKNGGHNSFLSPVVDLHGGSFKPGWCMLCCLCAMDSSDRPLVQHLLTSMGAETFLIMTLAHVSKTWWESNPWSCVPQHSAITGWATVARLAH